MSSPPIRRCWWRWTGSWTRRTLARSCAARRGRAPAARSAPSIAARRCRPRRSKRARAPGSCSESRRSLASRRRSRKSSGQGFGPRLGMCAAMCRLGISPSPSRFASWSAARARVCTGSSGRGATCVFPCQSRGTSQASTRRLRPLRCCTRSCAREPKVPDATAELERAAPDIPLNRDSRDTLPRPTALPSDRGAQQAGPVDLLNAILSLRGSSAYEAIRALGVDPQTIATQADAGTTTLPLRQLLVNANREAQVLGHYQVDSIHLLLALLYSDSPQTSAVLQKAGLTLYDVRQHLQTGARPDVP